jgi:hypothetical protein
MNWSVYTMRPVTAPAIKSAILILTVFNLNLR